MCLTTNDNTIKVAKRPIIVFKQLYMYDGHYKASNHYFYYTPYKIEEKVNLKICICEDIPKYRVEEGYHSYNSRNLLDGYHEPNCIFIIPKGAIYINGWYNDDKSIKNRVSSQIMLVGKRGLVNYLKALWYVIKNL